MAVGLLGGAFDPPHLGHLALVRDALAHFGFERLVVLPTGNPPHKVVETDAETRYRLATAAFAGLPHVEVSRHELDRPGPSYTVATARWAATRYEDPVFVVGADEFADFLAWKEPDEVLEYLRVGVASRPDVPDERLDRVLARLRRPERVEFFAIEPVPISSREIRARVAAGEPVDALVPPGVEALIEELGLYR
jgi:nicotinate-nucleotide adenylyltransferase